MTSSSLPHLSLFLEGVGEVAVGVWEVWLQLNGTPVRVHSKLYQAARRRGEGGRGEGLNYIQRETIVRHAARAASYHTGPITQVLSHRSYHTGPIYHTSLECKATYGSTQNKAATTTNTHTH